MTAVLRAGKKGVRPVDPSNLMSVSDDPHCDVQPRLEISDEVKILKADAVQCYNVTML